MPVTAASTPVLWVWRLGAERSAYWKATAIAKTKARLMEPRTRIPHTKIPILEGAAGDAGNLVANPTPAGPRGLD